MIKQTWEISNEERNRILSLHESATKNHYLMSEQDREIETGSKSLTDRVEFPSGLHSVSSVNLANLIDLSEIEEFLKKYDNKKIIVKLKSSESQVPNYDREVEPKKKLNPGDLSKMRYETIRTFMTDWLNGLISKGIISTMPEFVNTEPQIDTTTPWDPKSSPQDPKYTKHQFVEIEIDVTGENIKEIPKIVVTPDFSKVGTSRTEGAASHDFNTALFYNYSYAPAAVLGMTMSEAESLPGALLTMNRKFETTTPISKFNIPAFKLDIVPNGGQKVNVIILKSNQDVSNSPNVWMKWDAYVSDSYNLETSFSKESKEFQVAWLFIYWYIQKSFPQDWNFIGNKPENVDFNSIDLGQLQSSGQPIRNSRMEDQQKEWRKHPMNWYANMVKKVYG